MGLVSFLIPKDEVSATLDGAAFAGVDVAGFDPAMIVRPPVPSAGNGKAPSAKLGDLAYTRSGEKGETINVAVIARKPEYLPILRAALTPEALGNWFTDLAQTHISLYDVPGIHAINIVLEGALPGGINVSQRLDPAAKSIGQRLLGFGVSS